jgi:hypothetical protein
MANFITVFTLYKYSVLCVLFPLNSAFNLTSSVSLVCSLHKFGLHNSYLLMFSGFIVLWNNFACVSLLMSVPND